jgi:uridine phosphorylase
MKKEKLSELILNPDGSVYHLHLNPAEVAQNIILVGDPDRVSRVSSHFDTIELKRQNREFHTHTGYFKGRRVTVLSTGIGSDNIDIVLNELDALFNIDLKSGSQKDLLTVLNFIRIGTTGGIQEDIPLNSFILSRMAAGFDGVLNFYQDREKVSDLEAEEKFKVFTSWREQLPSPYFIWSSDFLFDKLNRNVISGITISAPGFYGPQCRTLRLNPIDPSLNNKITSFRYKGMRITNYEMESSALFGLASMLGHQAVTICAMIANRINGELTIDYLPVIDKLISFTLEQAFRN